MKRTDSNRATRRSKFIARLFLIPTRYRRGSLRRTLSRALSVSLIIILLTVQSPAAPQIIVSMSAQWSAAAALWLRSNGLDKRLLASAQKPSPGVQTAQSQRDTRVTSIHISPGDVTIKEGDQVDFSAIALDAQDAPISGVRFKWRAYDIDSNRQQRMRDGRFVARRAGTYRVVAEGARQQSSVTVQVEEDKERRNKRQDTPDLEKPVSSRDDAPSVSSLPEKKSPARERAATETTARAGKFAKAFFGHSAAVTAAPLPIDPDAGWDPGNGNHADDPDNRIGDPPGTPADDGAGSGNFQLSVPVLGLPGRSQNIALGLSYNSLLWSKTGTNQMTYDADRGWPAPGWALGFGKIIGLNTQGSLLLEPDGTRRSFTGTVSVYGSYTSFTGKSADGSFIDYTTSSYQGVINWAQARYPNGTIIDYGAPANGAVFPIRITDASGNYVSVTYRYNRGPDIDSVIDTVGRVIQFHYDTTGYGLLTAITAPNLGSGTRTLVRLQYQNADLNPNSNYGFASNIATHVRDANPQVLRAVYFPGSSTGYWFGDTDSYSSYGMLAKVVEQRSMSFSGPAPVPPSQGTTGQGTISPGTASQQRSYNYPMSPGTLTDAPSYTTATLSWANMDTSDSVTNYFVQKTAVNPSDPNTPSSKSEVTLPNGTKSVQYAYRLPGDYKDGLIYQDDTFDSGSTLISTSKVTWEKGAYESPRPLRVDATDERGQTLKTEFSYGAVYNQTTEVRAFDYDGVTLLRRTLTSYQNSASYTSLHLFNLPLTVEVIGGDGVRASRTDYEYDNATLASATGVVSHDPAYDPYNTDTYETGECCRWEQLGPYGEQYCAEYCQQPVFNPATNFRGLVTKVTSYSNAASEPASGPIAQTRTYDITGNLVTVAAACCELTKINYTINTQFAYPESQSRGSSDPNSTQRITTSATHDFNTGLVLTATDANARTTQTTYYQTSLRPQDNISPTGARTSFEYDDAQMTSTETSTLSAGGVVAAKSVTYINGLGLARRVEALGGSNAWDVMETKYDTLGRVWKQSRPYRNGSEQPQWSENFYDAQGRVWKTLAPDGSTSLSYYNETSRPNAATAGNPAGQTTRIVDAWGRERWGRMDSQGRLVEVVEPNPTGDGTVANGGLLTTYAYDTLGNLIQVNQGAQQRRFRHDSLGRLTNQKLAETSATLNDAGQYVGSGQWSDAFAYDTRSNLIARTDARGATTSFAYNNDPLNRLQSVTHTVGAQHDTSSPIATAATVYYEYLSAGDLTRLWKVTTENIRQDWFTYDGEGRLRDMTQTILNRLGQPMMTTYDYDALDRVTDTTYPAQYQLNVTNPPRRVVHQDYDVASRLSELKVNGASYASQLDYNAASQVKSLKIGVAGANQVTEKYVYDATTGLLSEQRVFRGTDENSNKLMHLSYNYLRPGTTVGRTGQLTQVTNNLNVQRGRAYTYDQLGRLKDATGGTPGSTPLWTQHYDYDRYGNRTGVTSSGNSASLSLPEDPSVKSPDTQLARLTDIAPPLVGGNSSQAISDSPPTLFGPPSSRTSRAAYPATPLQSSDQSLSLNGASYASVPSSTSLNVTGALTLEAWVKTNSAASQQGIVERYEWNGAAGGYGLRLSAANKLTFFTIQNSSTLSYVESTAAVSAGGWHHVAGVFDGSQLRVYIDGALAGSAAGTIAPVANASTLKLGAKGDDATYPFNGLIDEARVTAAALYTSNFTPLTRLSAVTGTRGLWKFDGQTLTDASGNGNNGSAVGAATFSSDVPAPANQSPTVSITSPTNNATFVSGSTITINANAADSDGTVSKVEFFQGATKLGEDTSAPYSYSWNNVAAGNYSLTAKATDNSGATTVSGAINVSVTTPSVLHSLSLNGASYASVPSSTSLNVTGALTLEAWVKTNSAASQQGIVERYEWNGAAGGYGLRLSAANKLTFFTIQNSSTLSYVESTAAVSAGGWHHVAGVFDGSQLRVYIDGALAGSAAGTIAPVANASTLKLGAKGDDATYPFNGLIDEARVTAAALYTSNFTPQTQLGTVSGTRGLWKFDGQTLTDASGNGNNGSAVGAATFSSDVPGQAANQQPVANAGGPYNATAGVAMQLNGGASYDPDGSIASYQWNFGDSTSGTGVAPAHTYASAGTYTVSLTVTDNQGAQATATTTVTVVPAVSPIPRDGLAAVSYDQTTNRINSSGWTYDAAGNQTRTQTASGAWQRMEYDAANRLVAVKTDAGALVAAYTYADSNARLISYEGGVRTYYAWNESGVIAEYTEMDGTASAASPQWSKSYVYLGERLLATQQPNGAGAEYVEYHHPDRLGTRVVTNNTNASFYEQAALPFGTALSAESSGATNRRFTSYDRSPSTGLDYAVNRHYDSVQGRFTQVDPLEMQASNLSDPQSLNLYAYCGNDPINNLDSNGLFWGKLWNFIKKALKIIAVAVTVAIAVITIIYAPYLFATTLKAVLGIIAAAANAAQSVLSALGLKTAAAVFGIISAAAGFGTALANLAGKGNMTWKNIFKAIQDGATLVSRTLSIYGHKLVAQVFDIISSAAGFISSSLKDIKDPATGKISRKFHPTRWEIYKFSRGTGEKVANLAGVTKVGGYLNVLGIVDDAYDFYRGIRDRDKDGETPDTVERLDILHNHRQALTGLNEILARGLIMFKNRAMRIGQEIGRINSIIGRVEKGIALAR